MKFCRNLQRVIDITDPEWAPYWTNYKMLKKFLKKMPSLVPPEGGDATSGCVDKGTVASASSQPFVGRNSHHPESDVSDNSGDEDNIGADDCVQETKEIFAHENVGVTINKPTQANCDAHGQEECNKLADPEDLSPNIADAGSPPAGRSRAAAVAEMSRNPGEVAFFKLLNSELKKAIHFFDKAQLEFEIREARVREGIEIMRKANSLMVTEKWSLMAKSLYRLYKDLLLLETYAIMTYCSFSKILKKHDKVTKHNTRIAFMKNVVNKANFTHYPKVLAMISRCERLYDEVSQSLILEGKSGLYEDERLFINMIHRLNEQVLDTAEEEGAPDVEERKEQKEQRRNSPSVAAGAASPAGSTHSSLSSHASQVSTLRLLVEENAMNKSSKEGLARVSESEVAGPKQAPPKSSSSDNTAVARTLAGLTSVSAAMRSSSKGPSTSTGVDQGSNKKRLISSEFQADMQQTLKRTRAE
mmetsp:Transcript_20796/g.41748  ORF Transcript_20796/g.41748 Transcript_20796/m.41748 type:complete len:472 (+) Transcript_20796:76-1491(+)